MASLLGRIVDAYDNDASAEFVALRAAVGTDKCYSGFPPEATAKPYIGITRISTTAEYQSKDLCKRVDVTVVQFDTFDDSLADVDNINELIQNAYCRETLTGVTSRTVMGVPLLVSSTSFHEERRVFHGIVELQYRLLKSPV
jgi:hypothetical protein